jgi:osmotically-inducible protein OsmY
MTSPYPDDRYYYNRYSATPASRSDADIKSEVVDRLRVNPLTADHTLTVDVKAGVVILTGDVTNALDKRAAGDDVWDTPGVVDVSNQLRYAPGV